MGDREEGKGEIEGIFSLRVSRSRDHGVHLGMTFFYPCCKVGKVMLEVTSFSGSVCVLGSGFEVMRF